MTRILYTGGTFDFLHIGHINFLYHCKKIVGINGKVVVALNTDEFVEKFKNRKPLFSYSERETFLKKIKYIDKIIPNVSGEDSKPTILSVKPNFIAIGTDWIKKDYYTQMQFTQEWLDNNDITLIYIPYLEGISSTIVKNKLEKKILE